jgi:alpha-L-fucosidase
MWRVDDAISKYHPDMIYFDEHAGDSQIDLGVHMGLGFLAPQLIANYYNKSLQWNKGKMDVVVNLKGVGGRYNSFQNCMELLPFVDRALVKSSEFVIEPEIMAYPFQTETSITDWHYKTGQEYMTAHKVIELLMQNVSRNGTMLLNLTQHGRGDLDPELTIITKEVGAWLKVNGEAIYGSRPFEVLGEDSVFYTRNNGHVYATILNWDNVPVSFKALHLGGSSLGKVSKVELLGSGININFSQDENGLTITPDNLAESLSGIENQSLARKYRVLRITHDKGWFNDDDPGVSAPGWFRYANLGIGDFNNDLTKSETVGDEWSCSFTGDNIAVIAPKEAGAGKMEINIDGITLITVDLSTTGERVPQQMVYQTFGLGAGNHVIKLINKGDGKVAVDALIIKI